MASAFPSRRRVPGSRFSVALHPRDACIDLALGAKPVVQLAPASETAGLRKEIRARCDHLVSCLRRCSGCRVLDLAARTWQVRCVYGTFSTLVFLRYGCSFISFDIGHRLSPVVCIRANGRVITSARRAPAMRSVAPLERLSSQWEPCFAALAARDCHSAVAIGVHSALRKFAEAKSNPCFPHVFPVLDEPCFEPPAVRHAEASPAWL
jgi:hypothetical protein